MGSGSACMEPTGTSRSCPSDQLDIAQRIAHNMTARNRAFSAAPSSCRTWIDQRPSDRTHRWRGPCGAVHQRPYALRVPAASSAASEVTWRSVRPDIEARVLWGLPENIAADIRLVGSWRLLSGPCKWASTDFDMHSDSPTVRADHVAPDLCRTCGHPLSAHDAISMRWCAASELGVENRACICSGVVQSARVLAHY